MPNAPAPADQKFSSIHTFESPCAFQIARCFPSGEGIAQPSIIDFSSSKGCTVPSSETFKSVLLQSLLYPVAHRLLLSAAQSIDPMPAQPGTGISFSGLSDKGRIRIVGFRLIPCLRAVASIRPSGERLQLKSYALTEEISAFAISAPSPLSGSK